MRHTKNIKLCHTNSLTLFQKRTLDQWVSIRNELLHLGIQQISCEPKYVNGLTYLQQHIQCQYNSIKTVFESLYDTIQKTIKKHLAYLDDRPVGVYLTASERCFYTKVNQLMIRLTALYVDEHFIQNAIPSSITSPSTGDISRAIKHIDYYLHSHNQQNGPMLKEKTNTTETQQLNSSQPS